MIDMLKGGLVPFIRVVEVLCDGNPYQDCYGCGKRVNLVNLEDVIIYKRIDLLGLSTPLCKDISAILHFGDIPILLHSVFFIRKCKFRLSLKVSYQIPKISLDHFLFLSIF